MTESAALLQQRIVEDDGVEYLQIGSLDLSRRNGLRDNNSNGMA